MQTCNFCYSQSQEKRKYSRQSSYFDILTPMRALAPSNHTYMLPLSCGCSNTSWVRISGQNCAIPGMARLSSGIPKLSPCFIEGGGICLTAACEAAYAFSLLCHWSVLENEERMGRKGGAMKYHSRSRTPPALLVHFSARDGANLVVCILTPT